jgi:hypothetical protein
MDFVNSEDASAQTVCGKIAMLLQIWTNIVFVLTSSIINHQEVQNLIQY